MTLTLDAIEIIAGRAQLVRANALNDDYSVPSPCISVCKMDDERVFCRGCLRTLDELRAWSTLDAPGKRAIWQLIETRLP